MFYVGQEVECVNNDALEGRRWNKAEQPKTGAVYTVGSMPYINIRGIIVIIINELTNPYGGYRVERFRPIQKKQTDISIFTALLNPANHKQLENT